MPGYGEIIQDFNGGGGGTGTARFKVGFKEVTAGADNQTDFDTTFSNLTNPAAMVWLDEALLDNSLWAHGTPSATYIRLTGVTVYAGMKLKVMFWLA